MGTKQNPGTYDCYANAADDEPMFILLARDIAAPEIVERWATAREALIKSGVKPEADHAMVAEALACAEAMRDWRRKKLGWKPIDTAPKDGTVIWAIEPGSIGVFAAYFMDPCFWGPDGNDFWPMRPSHWMPYDESTRPDHPEAP